MIVNFFGKFVFIVFLVVEFVLKYDVLIVLVYSCCFKDGILFEVLVEEFILYSDVKIMIQVINDGLEV